MARIAPLQFLCVLNSLIPEYLLANGCSATALWLLVGFWESSVTGSDAFAGRVIDFPAHSIPGAVAQRRSKGKLFHPKEGLELCKEFWEFPSKTQVFSYFTVTVLGWLMHVIKGRQKYLNKLSTSGRNLSLTSPLCYHSLWIALGLGVFFPLKVGKLFPFTTQTLPLSAWGETDPCHLTLPLLL